MLERVLLLTTAVPVAWLLAGGAESATVGAVL
jgi:hypothetical protein